MTRTPRIPDAALSKIPGKALYRMATAGAEVVIGGDHPTLVLPEARTSKWGGECWLRVRHADADEINRADKAAKASGKALKTAEKVSLRAEKGKPVLDIPTTGKGRRHEIREGSLKWDVVYDSPAALPADGVERFQLEFPEGLTWHYQPALTPEEIAEGAERPENVIGSYAGYWNQAGRYLDKNGEEIANYETGKFAHLYRPEMVDAAGNRCWAEQVLVGNELQVTLPSEWMATAVYPVRLDPTFGYESAGGSFAGTASFRGASYAQPVIGTITNVTAYFNVGDSSPNHRFAVYRQSDRALISSSAVRTETYTLNSTLGWQGYPIESPVEGAADDYVLCFLGGISITNQGMLIAYDSVSVYRYFLATVSLTPPDPFNGTYGTANFKYSIYATYTESGGGTLVQKLYDTAAAVAAQSTTPVDTLLTSSATESATADTLSKTSEQQTFSADTAVSVALTATRAIDAAAKVSEQQTTTADTLVQVSELDTIIKHFDTLAVVSETETVQTDTQVGVSVPVSASYDLRTKLSEAQVTSADIFSRVANIESIAVDSLASVSQVVGFTADTMVRVLDAGGGLGVVYETSMTSATPSFTMSSDTTKRSALSVTIIRKIKKG